MGFSARGSWQSRRRAWLARHRRTCHLLEPLQTACQSWSPSLSLGGCGPHNRLAWSSDTGSPTPGSQGHLSFRPHGWGRAPPPFGFLLRVS